MILLMIHAGLHAQISPGDLAQSHSELEGIRNCTQCHTIGQKISNEKCLNCHTEMDDRIKNNKGYHSSSDVRSKECAECHSDHHGRKFEMVRFDEKNFDHDLAGYPLAGAHIAIDCRECHKPDYIVETEFILRNNTYLGLSQECKSCHEDYHQGTLETNCAGCHVTDAFVPASLFDHDQSNYPLKGQHTQVDCKSCHQTTTRQGKEFQQFTGLEFSNCYACHEDPHEKNLGQNCAQCHSEQSFESHAKLKHFNHNQTSFKLLGSHQQIACASCHKLDDPPVIVFQENTRITQNQCAACHKDIHENKFGNDCSKCHNESSFLNVNLAAFDHDATNFALEGKHIVVDCKECHQASFRDPVPHNECASCHSDYHQGQFVREEIKPDCKTCHTVDGFDYSLYTIEMHNESEFPLEGAHQATPCFACHLQEDDYWSFQDIGQRCVDCHADVHEPYLAQKYYPNQSCESCHSTVSWQENQFNHKLTEFDLIGKHRGVNCMDCHKSDEAKEESKYAGFVETSTECISCHENIHGDQFMVNHVIDCARCHGFEGWGMEHFNHDKTAFKLEGKHADIECNACHKENMENGIIYTQYKFESFECIDCHL